MSFYPDQIPSINIGGRVFTDISNLIILQAVVLTSTRRSTFRTPNGTSGYAITAARTYRIEALRLQVAAAAITTNNVVLTLGYADNDLGFDSIVAPTNPITEAAVGASGLLGSIQSLTPGPIWDLAYSRFQIPAGKFPNVLLNTASSAVITLFGYETA